VSAIQWKSESSWSGGERPEWLGEEGEAVLAFWASSEAAEASEGVGAKGEGLETVKASSRQGERAGRARRAAGVELKLLNMLIGMLGSRRVRWAVAQQGLDGWA